MMDPGVATISTGTSDLAREKLREAVVAYGRNAFADPRRAEAILRDLCPNAPREIFLLVSALRENVAAQLISHQGLPEQAVLEGLSRRLTESLGLSADAARWAVESWRFALEDNPGLKGSGEGLRRLKAERSEPVAQASERAQESAGRVDWPWLAMCFLALAASVVALAGGLWFSFFHYWETWAGGLLESLGLALVLGGASFIQFIAARSMDQMEPANHSGIAPRNAPFALLPEVLAVLLLPLVPVVVPLAWAGEWWGEWHAAGGPHSMTFHIVRGGESMLVALFVWRWIATMTIIQGKIAAALVRKA